MTNESEIPCVLVVDDDTITLRFFAAAFRQIGITCVTMENGTSAKAAVENRCFELLLIDRHLPDTSGPALLKTFRDAGIATAAIATSAEVDAKVRSDLIDAGFDDVIAKPIGVEKLREVVARYIPLPVEATSLLDDDVALKTLGGSVESLGALRVLLANELDDVIRNYSDATVFDSVELDARLHRLRASCGFCGAVALAKVAQDLQNALHDHAADHRREISQFIQCCAATAARLRETPQARR